MTDKLKYSVTITTENVSKSTPILLRGALGKQIETANALGYDAVELQLRDPEKIDANELTRLCEKNSVAVSAIATGLEYSLNKLSMISDDKDKRERTLKALKKHIDLASEINSLVIIGCVRGNMPENSNRQIYWQRFDDCMLSLAEYADKCGVTLVIEAINYYVNNYLNSVAETVSYLKRLDCDNVKLHIDTHHMNIEDNDMLEAVRMSETHLGYVHFAGANRLYPGAGKLPYAAIQDELRRMNYEGYISLECVPVPDPYTAAKRGIKYLKSI
jgi:sugar phosphate isomerase/epimerase